jgi:hypothetical protein
MKMQHRVLVLTGAFLLVASLAVIALMAQNPAENADGEGSWTAPRTPWGDPDLQGIWNATWRTPTQRPREGEPTLVTDEEDAAAAIDELVKEYDAPLREGEVGTYNAFWREWGDVLRGRTELIVDSADGRIPPMTPEAQAREARYPRQLGEGGGGRDSNTKGPEDRSLRERCLTWDAQPYTGHGGFPRIVQAPGYVVISILRIHEARVIPLDGRPHLPQNVRQMNGDQRGHWEGDTLVVETTNFTDKKAYNGARENLTLVERFTRVDPNTINYEVTVSDPTTWVRPWKMAFPFRNAAREFGPDGAEAGLTEYACHEGNHALTGALSGARADDRAGITKITASRER